MGRYDDEAAEDLPLLEENQKIEDRANNSDLRTFILTIKAYVGSGVMGLPYAFLQGGVVVFSFN